MEEEVILSQIIEQAKEEADAIIAKAEETVKKIEEENTAKAVKQTEEQFDIIKQKVNAMSQAQIEKAEFEARASQLLEKQEMIEIIKEKVKQKIKDIDDNTYIKLIDEKISRYKDEKDVKLILPKKCYEAIQKIALNYGMQVETQTDHFETGVIVQCGKIEYNYDFEENMKFMNEEIEKEIDTILFR